ncbi:MAG: glutamine--fructose-6-phosphate transaminase (isomerizing) [Deltaproteobacteria bacterium]|nr:glutamine--fructose-6-phosphate transaminase (isomerizing) [Deltaproteobacteria bacterium]
MCGIVGYTGTRLAEPVLIEGLQKLEYRGYDSAGICTVDDKGVRTTRRALGKLAALKARLSTEPCPGNTGIGHTRWATHGRPSEKNAHPHESDGVTVVHNGIIENHRELRIELQQQGRVFSSETDTEIFAHLIAVARREGKPLLEAMRAAISRVRGAYALAVVDERTPGAVGFARLASPLVVGVGDGEMFLASDVPAVLAHTRDFVFLEDGDCGVIEANKYVVVDAAGAVVVRPVKTITWSAVMAEKGGHKHFMHKEITEQPRAITDTLRGRLAFDDAAILLDGVDNDALKSAKRIVIIACGTSWHSGLVGASMIESMARVACSVELASEFRYRDPVLDADTLVLAISQSGETADTLAAIKEAKRRGCKVLSICNVVDAAIPRVCAPAADGLGAGTLYTRAGPEIGVASTKAFVTQLVALHLFALQLSQLHGTMTKEAILEDMRALALLPIQMEKMLGREDAIRAIAQQHVGARDMLFLGRGLLFPIALEGALKLKEISYIHAEGYAAGEMKHGPIALIDDDMPVLVLALPGPGYEKVVSNLEETRARGGRVLAVVSDEDHSLDDQIEALFRVPVAHPHTMPVLAVLPLQLFSYHVADLRGLDVDQPRNLAKSVTVE